jgi:plastocyanin
MEEAMSRSKQGAMALALLAAGLAGAAHAPGAERDAVEIKEHHYTPGQLTVPTGATVSWRNHDEDTHTVTATGGAFASAGLGAEEGFTYTFAKPGTYTYFCALHPTMHGTIVVR